MHIFSYRRIAERKRAQKRTSRGAIYAKSRPAARIQEDAVKLFGMGEETIPHTVSKTKVWHITTANNLAKPLWYVITSHLSHLNQHELYTNHPQVKDGEMITTYKELAGYLIPISEVRSNIAGKISSNLCNIILWFLALFNLYITILQMKLFLPCPPITEMNSEFYRPRLEPDILTPEELRHELIRIKSYEEGLGTEQMIHRLRNF